MVRHSSDEEQLKETSQKHDRTSSLSHLRMLSSAANGAEANVGPVDVSETKSALID